MTAVILFSFTWPENCSTYWVHLLYKCSLTTLALLICFSSIGMKPRAFHEVDRSPTTELSAIPVSSPWMFGFVIYSMHLVVGLLWWHDNFCACICVLHVKRGPEKTLYWEDLGLRLPSCVNNAQLKDAQVPLLHLWRKGLQPPQSCTGGLNEIKPTVGSTVPCKS